MTQTSTAPMARQSEATTKAGRLPVLRPTRSHSGVTTSAGPTKATKRIVAAPGSPSTQRAM